MTRKVVDLMIAIGVLLLIVALLAHASPLWVLGFILLIAGIVLEVLGMMGRAVGGRRHYY